MWFKMDLENSLILENGGNTVEVSKITVKLFTSYLAKYGFRGIYICVNLPRLPIDLLKRKKL